MSSEQNLKMFQKIKCCLSSDSHIIKDAVRLKCGGYACAECANHNGNKWNHNVNVEIKIIKMEESIQIKCSYCSNQHELNDEFRASLIDTKPEIDFIIELQLPIIYKELDDRNRKIKINDLETRKNEFFKSSNEVLMQVKSKVELYKRHFDLMLEDYAQQIDSIKQQMNKSTQYFEISKLNDSKFEYLQSQNLSNLYDLQKNVLGKEKAYDPWKNTQAISFVPNEIFLKNLEQSWIGKIVYSNESAVKHSGTESVSSNRSTKQLSANKSNHDLRYTHKTIRDIVKHAKFSRANTKSKFTNKKCLVTNRVHIKEIDDLCGDIRRICRSQKTQTSYICDYKKKCIFSYNFYGAELKAYNFNNELDQPRGVCFDDLRSQLYVGDCAKKKIFVFNVQNGMLTKSHEIGDDNLHGIDSLEVDAKYGILYISDSDTNEITEWSLTGAFLESHQVISPSIIRVKDEKLYVISSTENDNSIHIYERFSINWSLQKKIQISNWLNPCGLYIDEMMNILTVASKKVTEQAKSSRKGQYLYYIDKNGQNVRTHCIKYGNICDFCVNDDEVLFIRGASKIQKACLFKFEKKSRAFC